MYIHRYVHTVYAHVHIPYVHARMRAAIGERTISLYKACLYGFEKGKHARSIDFTHVHVCKAYAACCLSQRRHTCTYVCMYVCIYAHMLIRVCSKSVLSICGHSNANEKGYGGITVMYVFRYQKYVAPSIWSAINGIVTLNMYTYVADAACACCSFVWREH